MHTWSPEAYALSESILTNVRSISGDSIFSNTFLGRMLQPSNNQTKLMIDILSCEQLRTVTVEESNEEVGVKVEGCINLRYLKASSYIEKPEVFGLESCKKLQETVLEKEHSSNGDSDDFWFSEYDAVHGMDMNSHQHQGPASHVMSGFSFPNVTSTNSNNHRSPQPHGASNFNLDNLNLEALLQKLNNASGHISNTTGLTSASQRQIARNTTTSRLPLTAIPSIREEKTPPPQPERQSQYRPRPAATYSPTYPLGMQRVTYDASEAVEAHGTTKVKLFDGRRVFEQTSYRIHVYNRIVYPKGVLSFQSFSSEADKQHYGQIERLRVKPEAAKQQYYQQQANKWQTPGGILEGFISPGEEVSLAGLAANNRILYAACNYPDKVDIFYCTKRKQNYVRLLPSCQKPIQVELLYFFQHNLAYRQAINAPLYTQKKYELLPDNLIRELKIKLKQVAALDFIFDNTLSKNDKLKKLMAFCTEFDGMPHQKKSEQTDVDYLVALMQTKRGACAERVKIFRLSDYLCSSFSMKIHYNTAI